MGTQGWSWPLTTQHWVQFWLRLLELVCKAEQGERRGTLAQPGQSRACFRFLPLEDDPSRSQVGRNNPRNSGNEMKDLLMAQESSATI